MSKFVAAVLVGCLAAGVAFAADAIKIELKDFKYESPSETVGYKESDSKIFFYANGKAFQTVSIPEDGEYTLTIDASCDEALGMKAKMGIKVGDVVVDKSFELKSWEQKLYTFTVMLKKGSPKLELEFLNDIYKENEYDLNLYVHGVKLVPKKKK